MVRITMSACSIEGGALRRSAGTGGLSSGYMRLRVGVWLNAMRRAVVWCPDYRAHRANLDYTLILTWGEYETA